MQRELRIVLNGSSSENLQNCEIVTSVDTTGMACPYPSFESVKAMSLLNDTDNANGCIEIITDSEESAFKSIPSICQKRKWQFLVLEEAKELWRVRIKK
jgi:TusA-related sulfurtransferase